jgi:hypothetical protein
VSTAGSACSSLPSRPNMLRASANIQRPTCIISEPVADVERSARCFARDQRAGLPPITGNQ